MTTDIPPTDIRIRELLAPSIETRGDMRELVMVPLGAIVLALIIGALIMIATSVSPATILQSFVALADGALGSVNAVSETLTAAIPLVLAGLGIDLASRRTVQHRSRGADGGRRTCDGGRKLQHHRRSNGDPSAFGTSHRPVSRRAYAGIAGVLRAVTGAHEVIQRSCST